MVALDPIIPIVAVSAIVVLLIAAILRYFRQPYVIAYIISGIVLSSYGLGFYNEVIASQLGTIGIVLFLFFIGMEVSLPKLVSNWRIAILGTFFQIIITVIALLMLGGILGWPVERSILFGFVISLSSTAVVLKILENRKEINTKIGQDILGILLVQDLAVIPMLIILGLFGGESLSGGKLALPIVGGLSIAAIVAVAFKRGGISIPFDGAIQQDDELQVFAAILVCFGIALITGLLGLSPAFGAFVAGILIATSRETHWIHKNLNPFKVIFVAIFFVYVGMLINLNFIAENLIAISLLTLSVFLANTFFNAAVFRLMGDEWKDSIYSGALLSQIGEFSFVLIAIGLHDGIVSTFSYNMIISIIALTLLLSPFWIYFMKHMTHSDFSKYRIKLPTRGKSTYRYKG